SRHMRCKKSCPLYPPKADMCAATSDVRYGAKADIKIALGTKPALLCSVRRDRADSLKVLVRLTSIHCFGLDCWLECLKCQTHQHIFGRTHDQGKPAFQSNCSCLRHITFVRWSIVGSHGRLEG